MLLSFFEVATGCNSCVTRGPDSHPFRGVQSLEQRLRSTAFEDLLWINIKWIDLGLKFNPFCWENILISMDENGCKTIWRHNIVGIQSTRLESASRNLCAKMINKNHWHAPCITCYILSRTSHLLLSQKMVETSYPAEINAPATSHKQF